MNSGDVLRWTAHKLPGIEVAIRQDLIASVDAIAERGGRFDRALEIGSLIGFSLRSMSRRGTFDDRRELVRQGLRVGALVLAIAMALFACASAQGASSIVLAGCASLTAIAIATGLGIGALVLATVTAVVDVATAGSPTASSLLVLAAVAAGQRFDARRCLAGGAICGTALLGGCTAAALLPSSSAAAIVTMATIAAASSLMVLGWFDPRYAVAATLVWLWRFITVDTDELGQAIAAVGDRAEFQLLLARWLLMGVGVLVGWRVSEAAIRRCLTVFQ